MDRTDDRKTKDEMANETADAPENGSGMLPERLTPAARRALAEAEERRRARLAEPPDGRPAELGGRNGPEPVRYGDWEKNGIVSDF